MTQFRRTTERMGAAGIAQYQTARLRQAGMLPNPRKKSNPRLKKVPDHMKETPRKKAEGVYVFPKRKSYPIGDLYHARKAVLQSMWPNNLKNAPTVLQAVVATWPKYNWKAYWNKEAEEALYSHQRQGRGRIIPSYDRALKAGRGSWEQDDPATKHRNPRHTSRLEEGISKQQFIIEDAGQALQYALEMGDMKGAKKYIGQIEKARLKLFDLSAALEGSQRGRSAEGHWPIQQIKQKALQKTRGRRAAKALGRNPGKAMKRRNPMLPKKGQIYQRGSDYILVEYVSKPSTYSRTGWVDIAFPNPQGVTTKTLGKEDWAGRTQWERLLSPAPNEAGMGHTGMSGAEWARAGYRKSGKVPAVWKKLYAGYKKLFLGNPRKQTSSRRNPMPRKRPTRRTNAKTAMTKAEYDIRYGWRWGDRELDAKYAKYKKELKRGTQARRKTRGKKRRNPRMNRSEYMERLDNLHPHMSNPRKNSLWKKYSR